MSRLDSGLVARVVRLWRASGRRMGTVHNYVAWVRRFLEYQTARGIAVETVPTRCDAERFAAQYVGPRGGGFETASTKAHRAIRAWSFGLRSLGYAGPTWLPPRQATRLPALIRAYVDHRLHHEGVARTTVPGDVHYAEMLVAFLRSRRRPVSRTRIGDVDDFVATCSARMTRKSVAGICSSLRAFLRFLTATGRLRHDLASLVVGPRVRAADRPPRAMPWSDVKRLLLAIDVQAQLGRRDLALLLTMATYGMGAGEVLGLALDDVDWRARTLRVRRPKTGVEILLPLVDPVGRALAGYLRHGRPPHAATRAIFVSHRIPHTRLAAASTIRHRLVKYAEAAGLRPTFIGSHVLRHSHACRQVECGAPLKVVSDILGHRRPSSTSVYVRVATERLRSLALPVPK